MGKQARPDPAQRVELEFRKAIASVVLFNDQVTSRTGMSASESQTLHLLQLHGPLTPGELSSFTGLTSGTVTGVVDRLERLGFARRDPHPTDRRKVVVSVDAERLFAEFGPVYAEQAAHLAEVMSRFRPAQLTVIADFLAALVDDAPRTPPAGT